MYNRPTDSHQTSMFGDLESMLDQKHPLYVLANFIHWDMFEKEFKQLYSQNNGSMAKPIRRMVGLIILKHIRDESDESVVEQFTENAYYQYFCGEQMFANRPPCVPTELVQFRQRIGEAGIELILKESIRVNMELEDRRKADRRMRTIAGILLRKLMRDLPEENPYKELLDICMRFVNGEKYDGHTVVRAMEQVGRVFGRRIKILAGDRGYRGQEACGDTKIEIPAVPKPGDTAYAKQKKHKLFRKRAGIEPVIGHCKADHRLSRNFYKGLFGDSINVMLAAAAFNFKRVMNLLFCLILNLANMVLIWLEAPDRKPRTASASCHL